MKKLFGAILLGGLMLSAPVLADKNDEQVCLAAFSVTRDALYTLNQVMSSQDEAVLNASNNIILSHPSGYYDWNAVNRLKVVFGLYHPSQLAFSVQECLERWK